MMTMTMPQLRAPNIRQIRDRFRDNEYDECVALDPGRVLMLGGLSRLTTNASDKVHK